MINTIVHVGAVPFGYTSEMNECVLHYPDGHCLGTPAVTWYNSVTGMPPLPDVILSNTPPPSPLRRDHSCLLHLPQETNTNTYDPVTLSSTPATQPSFSLFFKRPNSTNTSPTDESLEQSEGVRATLATPHSDHHLHHLRKLLWAIECCGHDSLTPVDKRDRKHGQNDDSGADKQRRWRLAGGRLRKMADLFEANHTKRVFVVRV
ncbi:uncharacterized protein LOC121876934 isoform X2 [Homarus americanus]|uniref:uncharacterized protein LOC121876934 isoform X2 n=1 Tax=Homarus americanus TaxID=6706 RepID=UPI001C45A318|nr:uncharacterized protein LOC121876934 isoform X2 [Homarus americanus]